MRRVRQGYKEWGWGRGEEIFTHAFYGRVDPGTDGCVQKHHIIEYMAKLAHEAFSNGLASCIVRLQDVGENLDVVDVRQNGRIVSSLRHKRNPL